MKKYLFSNLQSKNLFARRKEPKIQSCVICEILFRTRISIHQGPKTLTEKKQPLSWSRKKRLSFTWLTTWKATGNSQMAMQPHRIRWSLRGENFTKNFTTFFLRVCSCFWPQLSAFNRVWIARHCCFSFKSRLVFQFQIDSVSCSVRTNIFFCSRNKIV